MLEVAGKKLDALVAEKVLGCKVVRYNSAVTSAGCECPDERHTTPEQSDELKDYSTSLTAAWEVVEVMRRDGFSFKLWQHDGPDDEAVVTFVCSSGPCPKHGNTVCNHHGAYGVEAGTLPLAICTAALIAMKALPENVEGGNP